MNPNDYGKFYEVYTTLQTIAANGGAYGLDKDETDALVQGIEELHRHARRIIEVYDTYFEGEPLESAIENLARIVDCTGGESR